jgi:hypothetical protein
VRRLPNRSNHEQGHAQVSQPFRSGRFCKVIHDFPTVRCSIAPNCVNLASYEGYPNDSSTPMAFNWNVLLAVNACGPRETERRLFVSFPMDLLCGRESSGITASDGTQPFGWVSDHVVAENPRPGDSEGGYLWCRQPCKTNRRTRIANLHIPNDVRRSNKANI